MNRGLLEKAGEVVDLLDLCHVGVDYIVPYDFEIGVFQQVPDMTMLMEDISHPKVLYGKDGEYFACIHQLVEMAGTYGFAGNLWHDYLTYLLVNHENAFSTACEIVGPVEGTINAFAMHDFEIFKQLYDFDLKELEKIYPSVDSSLITDYQNINEGSKVFNKRIRDRICTLAQKLAKAESTEEFMDDMVQFYKEFGVGKLGLHKAFRIDGTVTPARIVPITNIAHVHLDDLVGYEIAIKGILNQYYDQGLRIIEAYKHQFKDLNDIIAQVKNRNYKFIIYMDDLSFEEFEIEYKYLKAVIEGGLEKKPDNILIYATSNRRHLVREKFSDKEERRDDLHSSDTVQEKLSLVARFGVSIFFCAPDKKQFQNIVKTLAERHQVEMPEEELLLEANKWELQHGGLSGRTAQQFIDYLCGKNENK